MSAKAHRALYAQIPTFACKPGCSDCCGPVPFSAWEVSQMPEPKRFSTGQGCPHSTPQGCAIYEQRPLMCRLYGTVPEMRCPHGCAPDKPLSSAEGRKILKKYKKLAEQPGSRHIRVHPQG